MSLDLESLSDITLTKFTDLDSDYQQTVKGFVIDASESINLVVPENIAALAKLVTLASQKQWRIVVCGNSSKLNWGGITHNIQLIISTQKCDRLIEHNVGDLTVTVEAGMKLKDLQTQLQTHGQFLPIDPAFPEQATIGGIVATADTGSWRQRYGGIRDLILGISFIRADGEIAKAGGKVVKNVAGYDLMKLFTGAHGTLGIISQVTWRTFPLPASSQTIVLEGNADNVTQFNQVIRNSALTPTVIDAISPSLMAQMELGQDFGLIIRWQTITPSIESQVKQVQAIAKQFSLQISYFAAQPETNLWQQLREIISPATTASEIWCKLGIEPTATIKLLAQIERLTNQQGLAILHTSSGIGRLCLNQDLAAIEKLRLFCQQHRGYLSLLTAPLEVKQQLDPWGYDGNSIKMMRKLKQTFDPQNILNPGRFVGGI